jgi:hypothetical protein
MDSASRRASPSVLTRSKFRPMSLARRVILRLSRCRLTLTVRVTRARTPRPMPQRAMRRPPMPRRLPTTELPAPRPGTRKPSKLGTAASTRVQRSALHVREQRQVAARRRNRRIAGPRGRLLRWGRPSRSGASEVEVSRVLSPEVTFVTSPKLGIGSMAPSRRDGSSRLRRQTSSLRVTNSRSGRQTPSGRIASS